MCSGTRGEQPWGGGLLLQMRSWSRSAEAGTLALCVASSRKSEQHVCIATPATASCGLGYVSAALWSLQGATPSCLWLLSICCLNSPVVKFPPFHPFLILNSWDLASNLAENVGTIRKELLSCYHYLHVITCVLLFLRGWWGVGGNPY